MLVGLLLSFTNVSQDNWSGGAHQRCNIDEPSCYNSCPVVTNSFSDSYCLADNNLNVTGLGHVTIRKDFLNLQEHVLKNPLEAGGYDNDPDVVDIDGDGDLDILVADESFDPDDNDSIWIFVNDGYGNFSQFNLGTVPSVDELHITDMDDDGDLDIVATGSAYQYGQDVVLFVHKSDGSWEKCIVCGDASSKCSYSVPPDTIRRYESEGVFAADLDADGLKDILVAHYNYGHPYWFERFDSDTVEGTRGCTVEGKHLYFKRHPVYPRNKGASGWNVWAHDMDNDGRIDIIGTFGDVISIYWNKGYWDYFSVEDRLLDEKLNYRQYGTRIYYGLIVTDIDGDGLTDVVSTLTDLNKVRFYKNEGGRVFSKAFTIDIPCPMGIAMGDIDGDGDMDFYVASHVDTSTTSDSTVYALFNAGNWTYSVVNLSNDSMVGIPLPRRSYNSVGAGDFDGDGYTDLLVRAGTKGEDPENREGIYWYRVIMDYADSTTLISNKVDVNGPSTGINYLFTSATITGENIDQSNTSLYIRYGFNEWDLDTMSWVPIEQIASCSDNPTKTQITCSINDSIFAEFIQYKLILRKFSVNLSLNNFESPTVQSVGFTFDESITPIGSAEGPDIAWRSFQIFTPSGRLVAKSENIHRLPHLKPGIYILKGIDINNRPIERVILIR